MGCIGFLLLLEHELLPFLVDLVGTSVVRLVLPTSLELHYKLLLRLLLGLYALLLILPDFEPLTILVNVDCVSIVMFEITVFNDLIFWVDQVDAHIHELLVVVFVATVEAILPLEEVLVDKLIGILLVLLQSILIWSQVKGRRDRSTSILASFMDRRGFGLAWQILL